VGINIEYDDALNTTTPTPHQANTRPEHPSSHRPLREIHQIASQPLHIFHRHRIVITRPDPPHTPMTLQPLQQPLLRARQKLLLPRRIPPMHTKADIHPAPNALVRHDPIHLGRGVKYIVDDLSLLVRDGLLAADLGVTVGAQDAAHHLAGDPDAEDGQSVVEGGVLGDGGVVEDDGRAPDADGVQEGERREGGEEVFADDDERQVCQADVLLRSALDCVMVGVSKGRDGD